MINKKDFLAYEKVRKSGVTNMFDVNRVMSISGLTKEQCIEIMGNYGKLKEEYL